MKSRRKDKRGHWPPGKRRSEIEPRERRNVIARIRVALDRGLSRVAVARKTRVDERTIRRWLSGDDYPMPESARRVKRALRDVSIG